MLQFIFWVVIWLIVPGIMLMMLLLSLLIVSRVRGNEPKVSARAGFWAGLLLFVVFVVSQLGIPQEATFQNFPNFGLFSLFNWTFLGIGIFIGFFLLWGVSLLMPTRFVGILTLFLAAASSIALFSYFFSVNIRASAMFFTLGVVFGILLHMVLFPKSVRVLTASPAYLRIKPTFLTNCTYVGKAWECQVSLINHRNAEGDLNWNTPDHGVSGVTFSPPMGKLTPGQTIKVKISIPDLVSRNPQTYTFEGPENSVDVHWAPPH